MKKVTAFLLVLLAATAVMAADIPKSDDLTDYVLDQPSRIQITGSLTVNAPIWHRWRPLSYSELGLNCDLVMNSSYTSEPHFDMYCFNVTNANPVEFVVDSADFDTVVYIYCDPFDYQQPTVNAVFMDDDDGAGLLSAIMAVDGVTLVPGNDYWFIMTAYSASGLGNYSVSTSDNVILCGSVPIESENWSAVKGLFR